MATTHVDHGGPFIIRRREAQSSIEAGICCSLAGWNVIVPSGATALAFAFLSIVWILPKMPGDIALFAPSFMSPGLLYWPTPPLRRLSSLFLFSRTRIKVFWLTQTSSRTFSSRPIERSRSSEPGRASHRKP